MASLRTFGPSPRYTCFQHWPTLFVALRVSDATRFAIHCHVVRATPMVVNRGRYRDTSPPFRRGFFCLYFVTAVELTQTTYSTNGFYPECSVSMRVEFDITPETLHGFALKPLEHDPIPLTTSQIPPTSGPVRVAAMHRRGLLL